MSARRSALLCVAAAVASIVVLAPSHANGTTFRGLTTAQWEREVLGWEPFKPTCGVGGGGCHFVPRRSLLTDICEWLQIPVQSRLPLLDGDPAALPVLLELLDSPHPVARCVAVEGLSRIGEPAKFAMPRLLAAYRDHDPDVQHHAFLAVFRWDRKAARKLLAGK